MLHDVPSLKTILIGLLICLLAVSLFVAWAFYSEQAYQKKLSKQPKTGSGKGRSSMRMVKDKFDENSYV